VQLPPIQSFTPRVLAASITSRFTGSRTMTASSFIRSALAASIHWPAHPAARSFGCIALVQSPPWQVTTASSPANAFGSFASSRGPVGLPIDGPAPPALEVEKKTGSISSKSRSSSIRWRSTEPTIPRQPTNPTRMTSPCHPAVPLRPPRRSRGRKRWRCLTGQVVLIVLVFVARSASERAAPGRNPARAWGAEGAR